MLAQFQTRYPTGSLISELLQIHQGKFVVRVSAQVEGITRATGLAAAETLELAEDRARSRALIVLGISSKPSTDLELAPSQAASSTLLPLTVFSASAETADRFSQSLSAVTRLSDSASSMPSVLPIEDSTSMTASVHGSEGKSEGLLGTYIVQSPDGVEEAGMSTVSASDHSDRESRSSAEPFSHKMATKVKEEPIDLSDVIARTDVELIRLRWSPEQGRNHLFRKYGKKSRQQLTPEQLQEFLEFLQSLSDPEQPFT